MPPELEKLLILQDKDQTIRRLRLDLKRLPADEEQARQRLASDTAAVKAAKEAIMQNEVLLKNLELQTDTRRDTIGKLKTQQFETRKNEEFRALGHEVERYTSDVNRMEDEQLVIMEKSEALKAVLATAQKSLAETQLQVDSDLARLSERRLNVTTQLAEAEKERLEKATGIEADLLMRYDRIFNHRGDVAIAEMHGAVCKGCHMKVTAACAASAKADRVLTTCSNCSRFLYVSHFD